MLLLLRDLCRWFGIRREEVGGEGGVGCIRELATAVGIWRYSPLRSRYHIWFFYSLWRGICGVMGREKSVDIQRNDDVIKSLINPKSGVEKE